MLKIIINKNGEDSFIIEIYVNGQLVNSRKVESRQSFEVLEHLEVMLKCNSEAVAVIR